MTVCKPFALFRCTLIIIKERCFTPTNTRAPPPLRTSKRAASHPLQPLNNGPGPLKWSLMEALMGGGTHSYSIFQPAIPPLLQMGQRKCHRAQAFDSPGNCHGLGRGGGWEGKAAGNPDYIGFFFAPHPPPYFLICINPKQAVGGA